MFIPRIKDFVIFVLTIAILSFLIYRIYLFAINNSPYIVTFYPIALPTLYALYYDGGAYSENYFEHR